MKGINLGSGNMKKSVLVILIIVGVVVLGAGAHAAMEKYGGKIGSSDNSGMSIGKNTKDDANNNKPGKHNKDNWNDFSGWSSYFNSFYSKAGNSDSVSKGNNSSSNDMSNKITGWLSGAKDTVDGWMGKDSSSDKDNSQNQDSKGDGNKDYKGHCGFGYYQNEDGQYEFNFNWDGWSDCFEAKGKHGISSSLNGGGNCYYGNYDYYNYFDYNNFFDYSDRYGGTNSYGDYGYGKGDYSSNGFYNNRWNSCNEKMGGMFGFGTTF